MFIFYGNGLKVQETERIETTIPFSDNTDDDYPDSKDEVHLEDFFWTGSGDGPPDFLKKVHTGISKGKDVIVKTETVVATVYVDGNNVSPGFQGGGNRNENFYLWCISRKLIFLFALTANRMMAGEPGKWGLECRPLIIRQQIDDIGCSR